MAKWNIGEKNGFWKGGRSVASNGYVLIRVGVDHHLADVRGYAYEHRLIAEQKLGRRLFKGEIVHHKNGNKQDNRPENLEVIIGAKLHKRIHSKRTDLKSINAINPTISCECGCGEKFKKFDRTDRPRRFISGHNIHPHGN